MRFVNVIRLALAALLLAPPPASAQTAQTPAAIAQSLNQQIVANKQGAITAPILNGVLNTMNVSYGGLLAANVWTPTQTFALNPIFSACTGYVYGNAGLAASCATTMPASMLTGQIVAGQVAPGVAASNLGFTPLAPANNLSDVANGATALANISGSQAQNLVHASPNGSSGAPTFRALASADIPTALIGAGPYSITTTGCNLAGFGIGSTTNIWSIGQNCDGSWSPDGDSTRNLGITTRRILTGYFVNLGSSGTPVTNGYLTNLTLGAVPALPSQTANTFFAAPNGSSGAPTMRAIGANDIAAVNASALPAATTGAIGAVKADTTATVSGAGLLSDAAGFRNHLLNGDMRVAQRGASIATPANGAYTLDQWAAYWSGAAPASVAQVAGPAGFQSALQITGAASNTSVTLFQRRASGDVVDLVGQNVTLSANIQASVGQTVAWALYYPNALNTFGGAQTLITSGTWTVTTSAATYSATIAGLSANAANGLELRLSPNNGGAFISGTINITGVQLEPGNQATAFERLPGGLMLALCQRFYYDPANGGATAAFQSGGYVGAAVAFVTNMLNFPVTMRAAPTIVTRNITYSNASALNVTAVSGNTAQTNLTGSAGGDAYATYNLTASAEL